MNAVELGIEIARRRKKAGLTQAELARKAATTQAAISLLETGSRTPGWETLERIAIATGRPLRIVLGGTDPPSREERRRRVRKVLGDYQFDPWERNPSPAEARSLIADGYGPERFSRT